jgi:hypothetical protein
VALTPEMWLDRLTRTLQMRRPRLDLLRSYMDGNAPLPEGAEGCREAYQQFQKKARTNFGALVVDAIDERCIVSGFRVGASEDDDDQARSVWSRNRLGVWSRDVHRDSLGLGIGYVMVQPDPDEPRKALVTYERPEQTITEADPLRPWLVRAGLKVYEDSAEGYAYAFLHLPGQVFRYQKPIETTVPDQLLLGGTEMPGARQVDVSGGWELVGEPADSGLDFVPLFPFTNRGGLGEFETHVDVLDRINLSILWRMVTTAIQSFKQRGLETENGVLPREDESGNEIDYGEMFKPGPGALWELPPGVKIWESGTTDITPLLSAAKDDIRDLAAVTGTPIVVLMPDGANQSAEGARGVERQLLFKATDRIERLGSRWSDVQGAALAIEKGQRKPVEDIETTWMPVERYSLQEKADAATKATDLPMRDKLTEIWQFSAERADRIAQAKEAENEANKPDPVPILPIELPAPVAEENEPAMGDQSPDRE